MTQSQSTPGRTHFWRMLGWGGAAGLLALPLVAMQFTREVNWTLSDFIAMGILIGGTGLLIEGALRVSTNASYRLGAIVTAIGCFMLVWVNAAVGMIGSENNAANLAYALIPVAIIGGCVVGRLRAGAMAAALTAAGMLQIAIGGWAYAGDLGREGIGWPRDIAGVTILFTGVWLAAAALFARAARSMRG